jgi:SAM-dependent methyltransferase
MHESVREFIAREAPYIEAPVLDVGSYDVNGTVRDLFPHPQTAWGVDIVPGPGVDEVYDGLTLPLRPYAGRTLNPDEDRWGSIVCCEVFEHVANPLGMAAEFCRVVKPGGTILLTARGCGFGYHNPPDRWRYMPGTLCEIFDRLGCRTMEWPDPGPPGFFIRAVTP